MTRPARPTQWVLAVLLLACATPWLAGASLAADGAADPSDGPGAPFRDDLIDLLAGDWKLTRSIRGKEVENRVHAEWVLAHQFLQIHMVDVAQPPAYEAILLLGYSHADSRYVLHWCDVYGGRFSADGFGRRSGDSIEFTFQYPDGPFFNTFTWNAPTGGWTFKMENAGKDGGRSLFAIDTLRRP